MLVLSPKLLPLLAIVAVAMASANPIIAREPPKDAAPKDTPPKDLPKSPSKDPAANMESGCSIMTLQACMS